MASSSVLISKSSNSSVSVKRMALPVPKIFKPYQMNDEVSIGNADANAGVVSIEGVGIIKEGESFKIRENQFTVKEISPGGIFGLGKPKIEMEIQRFVE